ncbi:MAG: serine hydroxymethyltransferase [Planctomycetota bacterium]
MTAPVSSNSELRNRDPEASELIAAEERRQRETLTLIASENHCSPQVREACSSVLTDKYAEGYPGARYYAGCEVADKVEILAQERALKLFPGAEHANVQPHSGTTANLTALQALAGTGGSILGMALADGGHLSHGFKVSHTGKVFDAHQYGVDQETGLLDLNLIRDLAKKHRPKVIIAGASSYAREIDFAAFAEIAREVEAYLMADIAHPAGLVAAGLLASPIPHADVITMTTHKTLRGPRGGMVLCREELKKKVDSSVFPGGQGGPLMHQIVAKAVAFGEALHPDFKSYQQSVRDNARQMAETLSERGLAIVSGGTDNHIVLIDLRATETTGADAEERCLAAGIAVNKNMVPGDPRPPRVTSGIRIGTAAMTSRGMGKEQAKSLAGIIADLVDGKDPDSCSGAVRDLCVSFGLP